MIFALSGSHGIGKTSIFNLLKKHHLLKDYIFLPEVARGLANILGKEPKVFLCNTDPYIRFMWENLVNDITCFSYYVYLELGYKTKNLQVIPKALIVSDRSFIDTLAYSKVYLDPERFNYIYYKIKHAYKLNKLDIFTFLLRNKDREDEYIAFYIKEFLKEFNLPFKEFNIPTGKDPKEIYNINYRLSNYLAEEIRLIY